MRTPRTLSTLLAAALAASALAMAPAITAADVSEEETVEGGAEASDDDAGPELYEACDEVEGATAITPEEGFDGTVPTPIGVGNFTPAEDAGLYQLDLTGLPVGSFAQVRMTLSWDTPALGDYDLVVNGHNELSTADPETHSRTLQHCDLLNLETLVFTGTPLDTLTLKVNVSNVVEPLPVVTPTSSPSPEPEPSPEA